jgi:hypothetical protein
LMDARIKSGHDGSVLWRAVKGHITSIFKTASNVIAPIPDMRSRPRGAMRPSCAFIFRPHGGRGECRVPAAPAASCALCIGRKHTSNNEYTGTPGIPARNGFNSLCRALPGDRALLPPSSRGYLTCPHPVGPTCLPQNLTPASGRQDHTILPSAISISRQRAVDRSRIPENPPCDPIARKTLPRPPHPTPRP